MTTEQAFYDGNTLENVKEFEYLGIKITPRISPTAHLEHRYRKAVGSTMALNTKLDFRNINFESAVRLYLAVIIPSARYGIEAYQDKISEETLFKFYKKVAGFFWKRWCGVSNYVSTTKLTERIFNDDSLNLRGSKAGRRRLIALLYAEALHVKICQKDNCYRTETHNIVEERGFSAYTACRCRFCGTVIVDGHVLQCPALPGVLTQRLGAVVDRRRNPPDPP